MEEIVQEETQEQVADDTTGEETAPKETETTDAVEEGANEREKEEETETTPETVPYARFKEVYGALKRTERENAELKHKGVQPTTQETGKSKPKVDDFDTYDEYAEALTDWKIDEREAARAQEVERERNEKRQRKWDEQVAAALVKDPKFLEKGYIPTPLVDVIGETDHLIDLAYYFGENPLEAQKLLSLSRIDAAKEIGRLEVKFTSSPPQRTKTNAPVSTAPLSGKQTTEKDPEEMTQAEYRAWRAAGGGK